MRYPVLMTMLMMQVKDMMRCMDSEGQKRLAPFCTQDCCCKMLVSVGSELDRSVFGTRSRDWLSLWQRSPGSCELPDYRKTGHNGVLTKRLADMLWVQVSCMTDKMDMLPDMRAMIQPLAFSELVSKSAEKRDKKNSAGSRYQMLDTAETRTDPGSRLKDMIEIGVGNCCCKGRPCPDQPHRYMWVWVLAVSRQLTADSWLEVLIVQEGIQNFEADLRLHHPKILPDSISGGT
jgi:hypothetical protein